MTPASRRSQSAVTATSGCLAILILTWRGHMHWPQAGGTDFLEILFGERMPAVGRLAIPFGRLEQVADYSASFAIKVGHFELRFGQTLLGGLAQPEERLGIILGQAFASEILQAQH